MPDILKIIIAFVLGYLSFVAIFYYVGRWMFPKIEIDEEYERYIEVYHRSKVRATRITGMLKSKRQFPKTQSL